MAWWGKAVGGVLGLLAGGPLGAAVGAALGHGVDRGAERVADLFGPERAGAQARLPATFVEATFTVLGHLSKSDGRVSEAEIAFAESVMGRMGLTGAGRQLAIAYFKRGKSESFNLGAALADFRQASPGQVQVHQLFLEILIAASYMEGPPSATKRVILEQCRHALQVPLVSFRRLERMIELQYQILGGAAGWRTAGAGWGAGGAGRRGPGAPPTRNTLAAAYAVLGIPAQASDEEVKRAYRTLMNRHHPDKLTARGAPAEAITMATQKTTEIRRAYDSVMAARGGA